MKISAPVSIVMMIVLTVGLIIYMALGVLSFDPRKSYNEVTINVATSGGLMTTSPVLFGGAQVGKVESINTTATGLSIKTRIEAKYRIPADSRVEIANLSVAGEQYLNFKGTTSKGPYLADGANLASSQVDVSTTIAEALVNSSAIVNQVDTTVLDQLVDTINTGLKDRDADLDKLGRTAALTAKTVSEKLPEITRMYLNLQNISQLSGNAGDLMRDASPALAGLAAPFAGVLASAYNIGVGYNGGDGWRINGDRINKNLNSALQRMGPTLQPVLNVLLPIARMVGPSLRLDLGSMLGQLDQTFPGGTARVTIGGK